MLVNEIIELLASNQSNLTDALLKTKILLHQIGKKELAEWVNNELNGYPDDAEVPPYRVLGSQVLANLSNLHFRYTAHPIPISHLKQEHQDTLQKSPMHESLAVLQDLAERSIKQKNSIRRPLPMELNRLLGQPFRNSFAVEQAWCEVSPSDVLGILGYVRSRLLDFLLELSDTVGDTATEVEFREKTKSIDASSMFNNAIFGSNTTILIGNQSSIAATQTIGGSELSERVQKLVDQLEKVLPTSGLPTFVQADSERAMSELRAASSAATPDVTRLRRGLESLKRVMEHAAGHLVATGVLTTIGELLGHAAT